MKTLLAVATLVVFGSFAFASANAGESGGEGQTLKSPAAEAASPSTRVRMAFQLRLAPPPAPELRIDAPKPAARPAAVEQAGAAGDAAPWYGRDPSLQRGDVVVTETGALVYEGETGGKRKFRTVGLSRLVTGAERETIIRSVRR